MSMCPNAAIKMRINSKGVYVPRVNNKECGQCGVCLSVCPGTSIDIKELNSLIFGKIPKNVYLGNYVKCYVGYAIDEEIRWDASSGGLVTALLVFALKKGIIDGALVTRMSENNPLLPEVYIAKTKDQIVSASRSKYCPVPANVALKRLLNENGKFAIVGLPCHIHGVRKAEMLNKKLKEKIVLHLGLFCSHAPSFLGTEFLFQKFNIKKDDVKKIDYRGRGWPGMMSIELKNGSKKIIPYSRISGILFGSSFFTSLRCTLCSDGTSELADISFGDAWLPELADDKIGTSICISRNEIGEEFIRSAISEREIELNEISTIKVVYSQRRMLHFKKNGLKARISLFKMFGRKVPIYTSKVLEPKISDYFRSISLYLHIYVSFKRHLWGVLSMYTSLLFFITGLMRRIKGKN
jgi:coenzyme F420 hydrogenase subunit beta